MELSAEISRFLAWAKLTREEYLAGHLPDLGFDHQHEWEDLCYPHWDDLNRAADGLMDRLTNEPDEALFDGHLDDLIAICCIDWCDGHSTEQLTITASPERRGRLTQRAFEMNLVRTHELIYSDPELYFDHEPTKQWMFTRIPFERDERLVKLTLGAWWSWDTENAKDLAGRLSRYPSKEVRDLAARISVADVWDKVW